MTTGSTKLRIVAGKGGVGRSTVAVALAARAAEGGGKVLAIDATASGGLDDVVAAAGLNGRFETLRLTTRSSLDEYLKIYLKLPLSASRLGPLAKIFDYVSAAAPGVRELLIIGKIGWEVREGNWDEIIVDGPATGHVVELLTAPTSMAELVPAGPLASQTGWLREILAAPTTGVVVVTVPEELPVTETGELLGRLRTETDTRILGVVINKVPGFVGEAGKAEAARLADHESGLSRVLQLACARHDVAGTQIDRLSEFDVATVHAGDRVQAPVAAVIEALSGPDAEWLR